MRPWQGTGQLPKFADDLFHTTDDRWLIPTAEVPLANLVAGDILDAATLPIADDGLYAVFPRRSRAQPDDDTRGMIRQHQFSKVELVTIAHPEQSAEELERMTNCAETILQRLGLSYRVMMLSSGDTDFSARRTYDIEVWLPGQEEGAGRLSRDIILFQLRPVSGTLPDEGALPSPRQQGYAVCPYA